MCLQSRNERRGSPLEIVNTILRSYSLLKNKPNKFFVNALLRSAVAQVVSSLYLNKFTTLYKIAFFSFEKLTTVLFFLTLSNFYVLHITWWAE